MSSCVLDRFTQHRYKCDQAFLLNTELSPVAAYLDIKTIVDICLKNNIDAVHPGYGFLSENKNFAHALEKNGVRTTHYVNIEIHAYHTML